MALPDPLPPFRRCPSNWVSLFSFAETPSPSVPTSKPCQRNGPDAVARSRKPGEISQPSNVPRHHNSPQTPDKPIVICNGSSSP